MTKRPAAKAKTISAPLEIKHFTTPAHWEAWLAQNHTSTTGLWLQFYKKAAPHKSITYAEALDVALCYGWIDGQMKSYDEHSWIQRFTPRRAKSLWSKRNTEHIAHLTAAGRMQPAGLAAVAAAQADGRWQQAYDRADRTLPADLLAALAKYPAALTHLENLNKANRAAIAYQLLTAKKPETRARRLQAIIELLIAGKKLY